MTSPYGHRFGDDRMILVHVVAEGGWVPAYPSGITALAMCGAGLDREADWPGESQKWCPTCVDARERYLNETRVWPAGSFREAQ